MIGTELKKLLLFFNVTQQKACGCYQLELALNQQTPTWCHQNMELIVTFMEAQAVKRGWKFPLMRFGARTLIRLALLKHYATTKT